MARAGQLEACEDFHAVPFPALAVALIGAAAAALVGCLLEPNIKFFTDTLALMKDQYCVDENRIFVAGGAAPAIPCATASSRSRPNGSPVGRRRPYNEVLKKKD